MELLEGIMSRQSVRVFDEGREVEEGKLRAIVAAGMNAPTAMEQEAWRFLSVTDRELMTKMSDYSKWWKMLKRCPLAIVVMTDPSVRDGMDEELQIVSSSCAAENMLLAAHALGLGAVYLGICKNDENYSEFIELLGIPQPFRVMGVLAMGYPKQPQKPRVDSFDESKWIRERF